MLFGLIYGTTVAHYPKTIFITAAGILCLAIVLIFTLRPERQFKHLLAHAAAADGEPDPAETDAERGRSRSRKDIASPGSESGEGSSYVGSPSS